MLMVVAWVRGGVRTRVRVRDTVRVSFRIKLWFETVSGLGVELCVVVDAVRAMFRFWLELQVGL